MAGQRKHQVVRLVGVDPGDTWTGIAALEIRDGEWTVGGRVIHGPARPFAQTIDEVLRFEPTTLIVENYQQRPVGHQRFHTSTATKMIGALEYVAALDDLGWHLIPPGNPQHELPKIPPIWKLLSAWTREWIVMGTPRAQWQHGLAAWRVVARWMLTHMPEALNELHIATKSSLRITPCHHGRWTPITRVTDDVLVPTVRVAVPRSRQQVAAPKHRPAR